MSVTGTSTTGRDMCRARSPTSSKVGEAVTTPRSGVVNAITAASRISLDPQPSVTCSGWTPSLRASADWTSPAAANE